MSLTAWDGHARIDYLPHLVRLQVTLFTVEPTVEADLRRGLRAAFVPDDPAGPPAFVSAVLDRGLLPDDLRLLLGPRLEDAVRAVLAGPERNRFVRLDLVEVDDLAQAWAPYRAAVLAPAGDAADDTAAGARRWTSIVGQWAGDLWTALDPGGLRTALAAVEGGSALRGEDDDEPDDTDDEPVAVGVWPLPPALAEAAGIAPELGWAVLDDGLVEVTARRSGPAVGAVWVSFDDGSQRWTRLADDGAGGLTAELATAVDPDRLPSVRVRTEGGSR